MTGDFIQTVVLCAFAIAFAIVVATEIRCLIRDFTNDDSKPPQGGAT